MDRIGYLESKREPKTGASSLKMSESGAEVKCISLATRGSDALIATGRAPDIVVMCEAGTCEEDHFLAAVGRVTEKRGAVIMTCLLYTSDAADERSSVDPGGRRIIKKKRRTKKKKSDRRTHKEE